MHFGKRSNLKFALSAIVGPNTGQVRFVYRAMICLLQFFSDSAREYFHSRGSKMFGFKEVGCLWNGSLLVQTEKKRESFVHLKLFLTNGSSCEAGKLNNFALGLNSALVRRGTFDHYQDHHPATCANATLTRCRARSAAKTDQLSEASLVRDALTVAVALSHSAVSRARSRDKTERSRLIAIALPPG